MEEELSVGSAKQKVRRIPRRFSQGTIDTQETKQHTVYETLVNLIHGAGKKESRVVRGRGERKKERKKDRKEGRKEGKKEERKKGKVARVS